MARRNAKPDHLGRAPPLPPSRIHDGLVGARALVGTPYLGDPELRREYDEQIAPRTIAALTKIFAAIEARQPALLSGVQRVLDLGAGTGAAGAAARARFGDGIEVVSVDSVPGPGVICADVTRGNRPAGVHGRFDLIIAAHLLNELFLGPVEQATLVAAWCRELLTDDGLCVLLEPALPATSRGLLATRDRLIERDLHIVAPCLHAAPCPALLRERDFCHDAAEWLTPPASAGVSRPRSRVDFSYLVLSQTAPAALSDAHFRVVSDLLREKGRLRVFGCGPAGRHALVRLDRERSPTNATLDTAARGDVITVHGSTVAGDGLRLGTEATVKKS